MGRKQRFHKGNARAVMRSPAIAVALQPGADKTVFHAPFCLMADTVDLSRAKRGQLLGLARDYGVALQVDGNGHLVLTNYACCVVGPEANCLAFVRIAAVRGLLSGYWRIPMSEIAGTSQVADWVELKGAKTVLVR